MVRTVDLHQFPPTRLALAPLMVTGPVARPRPEARGHEPASEGLAPHAEPMPFGQLFTGQRRTEVMVVPPVERQGALTPGLGMAPIRGVSPQPVPDPRRTLGAHAPQESLDLSQRTARQLGSRPLSELTFDHLLNEIQPLRLLCRHRHHLSWLHHDLLVRS